MKRYPALDLFRFICACLVVVIHLGTNENTPTASMIVTCFSRQAVPFFLIVSGFFFAGKLEAAEAKQKFILDYSRRMFLFYLVWVLLTLPQTILQYSALYADRSVLYITMVLFRRIFLAGLGQFWYLLVLAETALIAGFLLKNNRKKILYGLAIAGFCMNILFCAEIPLSVFRLYNKIMYSLFSWNCNVLMMGLPFFTVGMFLSEKRSKPQRKPAHLICAYLIVSAIAVVCYRALRQVGFNPERVLFFYAPQAIALFQIGISLEKVPIRVQLSSGFRESSSAIYCLHNLVIEYFLGDIMPWSVHFGINYISVVLVCLGLYWVIKAAKFKPLYRLITLK